MPGTLIFKPIQAHFKKDDDSNEEKIDAYCKFKVGHHSGKTSIIKDTGSQAEWMEPVKLKRKHDEKTAKIKVKDHHLLKNDFFGEAEIDLSLLGASNKMMQWFKLEDDKEVAGEILVEIEYLPHS